MRGYGQFCPVALAAEVLCERWTLLVVRELLSGSKRFGDLQRGVPRMPKSMLAQRLRSLQRAGILRRTDEGYELTEAGEELRPIVMSFGEWGKRWVRHPLRQEDVDLNLLMWDMRRRVDPDAIPEDPVMIEFEFRDVPGKPARYWLHVRPEEVDLCLTHPGFEVDLQVESDPATMAEIWLGDADLEQAIRGGRIKVRGDRKLAEEFPGWLQRSVFSAVEMPDR